MARYSQDDQLLWNAIVETFSSYADALHGLRWISDPAEVMRHALQDDEQCFAALDIFGCLSSSVRRELVPEMLALGGRKPHLRPDVFERLLTLGHTELADCVRTIFPMVLRTNNVLTMNELLHLLMQLDLEAFALVLPEVCVHPSLAMRDLGESYRQRIQG